MNHPIRSIPDQYQTPPSASLINTLTLSWLGILLVPLLLIYLINKLLVYYDRPILSIAEGAFNLFVYLMPSRFVFALRPGSEHAERDKGVAVGPQGEHAMKSEVLRNVFGLDRGAQMLRRGGRQSEAPPGLGNWDNSCYQNSVLQALATLPSLRHFLEQVWAAMYEGEREAEETTLKALDGVVKDLNDASNAGRHLWTPAKLKTMSSWQQQDAQEYFSKIVDQLEKDIAAVVKVGTARKHSADLNDVASLADEESNALNTALESPTKSISTVDPLKGLRNPLEGLLAQRVGCTRCGHCEGLSLIPFNCITVPLGRENLYDIRECLDAYTELDFIEGVECAKCTLLQAKKKLSELLDVLSVPIDVDNAGESTTNQQYKGMIETRLRAIVQAMQDEDFSESTLAKKCEVPAKLRVNSTKSRQAAVMRAPQCLVMHVNRSMYDETTGNQLKNHAEVQFPETFDLSQWCIGNMVEDGFMAAETTCEEWEMDPRQSMVRDMDGMESFNKCIYELQAVITHYGRHENGHYICYRKVPLWQAHSTELDRDEVKDVSRLEDYQWWRLSDEDVSKTTEKEVLAQGGVFMLFYERVLETEPPITMVLEPEASEHESVPMVARGLKASDLLEEADEDTDQDTNVKQIPDVAKPALDTGITPEPGTNAASTPVAKSVHLHNDAKVYLPAIEAEASTAPSVSTSSPQSQSKPQHDSGDKKLLSPIAMRTSSLTAREAGDESPVQSMHMVATT